jgi:Something about silencing, SAS, complex subunit 4
MVVNEEPAKPSSSRNQPPASTAPSKSPTKLKNGANGLNGASSNSPFSSVASNTHYPKLHNASIIDLSTLERAALQTKADPLPDSLYLKSHKRCERQEKQLRNIEKERAQHEKLNLERLLDSLKGPDWLRVMGVSGITESEKKSYEPKRDIFIREVAGLLSKFQWWKEEEKRRKIEKEQAILAAEEEAEADAEDAGVEEEEVEDETEESEPSLPEPVNGFPKSLESMSVMSDGDPPDYSDVDAWAARQLHQEAIRATQSERASKKAKLAAESSKATQPVPQPEKPFTSFYDKPYLRKAAIGNHRRSGRSTTAFGRPLPELPERYFELPREIIDGHYLQLAGGSAKSSKK